MKRFIFYLSLFSLLSSCASFKEVNSFATSAEKSISSYKNIAYTFSDNCNFKCEQRALENSVFQTDRLKCACEEAVLADKNVSRLLGVLKGYFKGIADLSANKLTDYSFDAIEKQLVEGKYIKKAVLKPYTDLAALVTKMFTDKYRAKKLKYILEIANDDVVFLLDKTIAIIEHNLLPMLTSRQAELQQIYHDLYAASPTSAYEKFRIQKMYFSELNTIATKKEALKKFSASLSKISRGHQTLNDNKDKLKDKDVKKMISAFAGDLNDIVEHLKK